MKRRKNDLELGTTPKKKAAEDEKKQDDISLRQNFCLWKEQEQNLSLFSLASWIFLSSPVSSSSSSYTTTSSMQLLHSSILAIHTLCSRLVPSPPPSLPPSFPSFWLHLITHSLYKKTPPSFPPSVLSSLTTENWPYLPSVGVDVVRPHTK